LLLLSLLVQSRADRGLTGSVASNEGQPTNYMAANMATTKATGGMMLPNNWQNPGYPDHDFLIVSSPTQKKVVYTKLTKEKSKDGIVYHLINGGLIEPKGLALDRNRGFLYIADSGAQTIWRYTIIVTDSGSTLETTHIRTPIVEDCGPVEFVTLDDAGNLFYSSPKTNNINKIPFEVMLKISSGEFQPLNSTVVIVSQKTLQSAEMKPSPMASTVVTVAMENVGDRLKNSANLPEEPLEDAPEPVPKILSIYEASLNSHVSKPGAIVADGEDLYWTNTQDGAKAGTVVKGQVNPHVVAKDPFSDNTAKHDSKSTGPAAYPAEALTKMSNGASAIAKTDKRLFFIRNGDVSKSESVSGLLLSDAGTNTGIILDFVKNCGPMDEEEKVDCVQHPTALAWDRDETIYVADEAQNRVYSFPTGRFMANVPLTEAVKVQGPFSMVIMHSEDPCFTGSTADEEGVHTQPPPEDLEAMHADDPAFLAVSSETATASNATDAAAAPKMHSSRQHIVQDRPGSSRIDLHSAAPASLLVA